MASPPLLPHVEASPVALQQIEEAEKAALTEPEEVGGSPGGSSDGCGHGNVSVPSGSVSAALAALAEVREEITAAEARAVRAEAVVDLAEKWRKSTGLDDASAALRELRAALAGQEGKPE